MPPAAQVTLHRSGKVFAVNCDEVILEAALRQEIWLPHACRGGTCGSCRATIVAGAVTYDSSSPLRVRQAKSEAYLCCAKPLGDIVVDVAELAARPIGAMLRRPARVSAIVKPSRDVAIVTLRPPPNATISFRCGQYISLVGDDGRLHPFSIANAPRQDGTLELHIGRVPDGPFTTHVHERTRPGDILRFEGPFGEFGFSDSIERPAILVAGGTGIAPIKAMLEFANAGHTEKYVSLLGQPPRRRSLRNPGTFRLRQGAADAGCLSAGPRGFLVRARRTCSSRGHRRFSGFIAFRRLRLRQSGTGRSRLLRLHANRRIAAEPFFRRRLQPCGNDAADCKRRRMMPGPPGD